MSSGLKVDACKVGCVESNDHREAHPTFHYKPSPCGVILSVTIARPWCSGTGHPPRNFNFEVMSNFKSRMSEYRLSDYQRPRLNILRNSSRNGLVIPLGQYQNIEGLKDEICEKLGKIICFKLKSYAPQKYIKLPI